MTKKPIIRVIALIASATAILALVSCESLEPRDDVDHKDMHSHH